MDQLSGWDVQRVVGLYGRVCGRYSHVRRDRDAGFDNAAELCGRNFAGAFLCFDLSYDPMLSSSKTTSAVVCILAAVFMMVFAGIIFSKLSQPEMITQAVIANGETVMETVKNPAYLTGISRTVYQNILDFLPAGQAVQIFNQGVLNLGKMMGYSILIIFGTSLAGLYLFNRKDIK